MYRLFSVLCILGVMFLLVSCNTRERNQVQLVRAWQGKEIVYPDDFVYTVYGEDTIKTTEKFQFQIFSYVDSIGCMSCKLKLGLWKSFIEELNAYYNVSILFVFQTEMSEETKYILKRYNFNYPVVFNKGDAFIALNNLPADDNFRTFLLDKDNKVLAIGNPIHNPKVKELYLKIIQGEEVEQKDESKVIRTKVDIGKTSVSLGNFDWEKEQKTTFVLKNTGNKPLVVEYVNTSCGCTSVDYSKEPVQPGEEMVLNVIYKAEHPEYFDKTITVYCNVETSPIVLRITGNAE
ncbi:MAG: DUF1573 domain-containing protein [Bacteroides intestinalis]|nr:DUF1573 domain-containing protein [Bacteroides intestinalis]